MSFPICCIETQHVFPTVQSATIWVRAQTGQCGRDSINAAMKFGYSVYGYHFWPVPRPSEAFAPKIAKRPTKGRARNLSTGKTYGCIMQAAMALTGCTRTWERAARTAHMGIWRAIEEGKPYNGQKWRLLAPAKPASARAKGRVA